MHTNRRGHGALLLVVLIGMLIILLLYFSGGSKSYSNQISQTRKQGKQTVANIETGQLTILIAQYRQENGKLPKSWDDIESAPRELYAPFGKPMTFRFETDKRSGKTTVFYHSDGPDGEPNTGDEIDRTDTLPY